MDDVLRKKLSDLNIPPPLNLWTDIATRLDTEFDPADALLASRLDETAIAPPPSSWKLISASLVSSTEHRQTIEVDTTTNIPAASVPVPLRKIPWQRWAAAAMIAGLVFIGGLVYFNSTQTSDNIVDNTPATKAGSGIVTQSSPGLSDSQYHSDQFAILPSASALSRMGKRSVRSNKDGVDFAAIPLPEPANIGNRPEIQAPPIRDHSGRIILDLSLVADPLLAYIPVTAPNGSLTKISTKFVDCITYLNNHPTPDDSEQARGCLDRFRKWRATLLTEAAFVPAASNFFDIFELQQLIQER